MKLIWVAVLLGMTLGAFGQSPRLLVPIGHTLPIKSVAFSPDGSRVATASFDYTARVWDVPSGKELLKLTGHDNVVESAAFSPDGSRIVTASADGTVRIWNAASGKALQTLDGKGVWFSSAAFSPDGLRVVTASHDKSVRVWDASTGKELLKLDGSADFLCAAFSPNGLRIVTASQDRTARVWDASSGREMLTLVGHTDSVTGAAFSPNGSRLLTASLDKTARVWDASSGRELVRLAHGGAVGSAAFSRDGSRILTASWDGTAHVWNAVHGQELLKLAGHAGPGSAAFSPDGSHIASALGDSTARVWDASTGKELARFGGQGDWVNSAAFSPNGAQVLTSGGKTARLWDGLSGKELLKVGENGAVNSAAFSPDGSRIVSSAAKTARVWDVASGKELLKLEDGGVIASAGFSPSGSLIFTVSSGVVSGAVRFTMRVWDSTSGKERLNLDGPLSAAFSPDGSRVVSASADGTARVWDASTGHEFLKVGGLTLEIGDATFSPDGSRFVTGCWDGTARVWDAASGRELLRLQGHQGFVAGAAFSPDGSRIVTASYDKTARVWDAASGKELLKLEGHGGWVNSVAFSNDGSRIVTASADGTARVWDATTGKEFGAIIPLGDHWAVTTPDGRFDTDNLDGQGNPYWIMPGDPLHPVPLEAFMRQYYTPALLRSVIKGEKLPDLPDITKLNIAAPEVQISKVTHGKKTGTVDVEVNLSEVPGRRGNGRTVSKGGVYDLRLFRQGRLVAYVDGRIEENKYGQAAFSFKNMPLAPDEGPDIEFTAYAFNSDRVKSETASATFKLAAPIPPRKGKLYLISVGINDYEDLGLQLRFAAADAEAMQRALPPLASRRQVFEDVVAVKLVSAGWTKDAMKKKIRAVLLKLAGGTAEERGTIGAEVLTEPVELSRIPGAARIQPVRPEDTVIVTWSGHGTTDPKDHQFYLLPSDCGDLKDLTKLISSDELARWMRDIDSTQIAFIIDACHSNFENDPAFKPGPMGDRGLGQLAYDKKMLVLAAARDAAFEDERLGMGLVTYSLVKEGLDPKRVRLADFDLRAWLKYAEKRVPELYAQIVKGRDARIGADRDPKGRSGSATNKKRESQRQYDQHPQLFDFERNPKKRTFLRAP